MAEQLMPDINGLKPWAPCYVYCTLYADWGFLDLESTAVLE